MLKLGFGFVDVDVGNHEARPRRMKYVCKIENLASKEVVFYDVSKACIEMYTTLRSLAI